MPTAGPRSADSLAREALRGNPDMILVAGGDGTLNEAINGVVPSVIPVGIVPMGTANVLGCELGIARRLETAVRLIPKCLPERVAVGRLCNAEGEERYFLLMAGVGLDAMIVYDISASLKAATGKLAYWLGGFSHLTRPLRQFQTNVNGTTVKCGFALASRVRNYGGDLEIASGASLLENHFETVLFRGRNPIRYMVYFLAVAGRVLPRIPGISIEKATRMDFTRHEDRRIYVQVDGEFAGHLPASVEIVPDALTLLVPPGFRARFGYPTRDSVDCEAEAPVARPSTAPHRRTAT